MLWISIYWPHDITEILFKVASNTIKEIYKHILTAYITQTDLLINTKYGHIIYVGVAIIRLLGFHGCLSYCRCLWIIVRSFPFGHCIVRPSYDFKLPYWHLPTFLKEWKGQFVLCTLLKFCSPVAINNFLLEISTMRFWLGYFQIDPA
jgi:hypothetical protein